MKRFLIIFLMFIMLAFAGNADAAMSGSKCFDDGLGHESCFYINQSTRSIMYKKYNETAVDLGAVWSVEGLVKVTEGVISAAQAADILTALGTNPISATVNFATGTVLPESANPGEIFIKLDAAEGDKLYYAPVADTWEQVTGGEGPRPIIPASEDYNLTPSEISTNSKGILVMASAALDVGIPENSCDTATGTELEFKKTTGDTVSIYSNDPADQFVTSADVALTAGHELDLAAADGSSVRLCCAAPNKWYVMGQNGTAVDGGTRDGGPETSYLTDQDVIAAYYFENDATDETAKGNDLTANNAPTYETTTPAPKQGTYSAEGLYSSSQFFSSTSADFNQLRTGPFSVAAWVYYTGDTGYVIFGKGTTTGNLAITLFRNGMDNCLGLLISADGSTVVSSSARKTGIDSMPYAEWVHVGLTYDETTFRIYLNGYEHTGGNFPYSYSGAIFDSTEPFTIMKGATYPGNIQHFSGNIDEFYVSGRTLSAAEILDIYTNGLE